MRPVPLVVCLSAALTTLTSTSMAAPSPRWRNDGNAICSAAGRQHSPAAITDAAGGAIVLWSDERRGPGVTDLYAQRVLPTGATGWTTDGVAVLEGIAPTSLAVAPDGAGGVLVLHLEGGTLRAKRVLADGTAPGDPAGRVVATGIGAPSSTGFAACPDREGGAYVSYLVFDIGIERMMLTRVDPDGAIVAGWDPPIEVWATSWDFGGYAGFTLASPPAGGVITAFSVRSERLIGADYFGHARAYGGDASLTWAVPLNAALAAPAVTSPQLVPDLNGGSYLRIGGGATNHLDGTGTPTWPTSPAIVTPQLLSFDFDGGLYATEFVGQTTVVHRLDTTGALPPGWTAAGVTIASTFNLSGYDVEPLPGGLMFAWSDVPAGDIRVGMVAAAGTIGAGWSPGGELACRVRGAQTQPTLVPLSESGGLVAWTDTRRDDGDIFATVAGPGGGGGPRAALERGPTREYGLGRNALLRLTVSAPAGGGLLLSGSLPEAGSVRLEVFDVTGRIRHAESFESGAGTFSRSFVTPGLGRGIYWARLSQGTHARVARFARVR